ncbi:hypothetical protein KEM52_002435 [Ascosphaera acerosa]|nr:hypothetical protein KEM52_002435 [Ascosphaera acerosa]
MGVQSIRLIPAQRFGNAITDAGTFNLKHASYATDFGPVMAGCTCKVCTPQAEGGLGITRAYIHHLAAKETVGAHLYAVVRRIYERALTASGRRY